MSTHVEPSTSDGEGLEETIEDSKILWDCFNRFVANVEDLEGDPVDAIQTNYHEEEPPSRCRGKEVCIDAARVAQNEAKGGFVVRVLVFRWIDGSENPKHGPKY